MKKKYEREVNDLLNKCDDEGVQGLIVINENPGEVLIKSNNISNYTILAFIESTLVKSDIILEEVINMIGEIIFEKKLKDRFNIEDLDN